MKTIVALMLIMVGICVSCGVEDYFVECEWSRWIYMACSIALGDPPCVGAITDGRYAPPECRDSSDEQGTAVTQGCLEAWGYVCVDACRDAEERLASGYELSAQEQADYEEFCLQ